MKFTRKEIGREVEEELGLHLDLLTQDLQGQHESSEEAKTAAQKRFGDFDQIRDECVEISRRRHPLIRALKSFLILVFLSGVLVRVFSPEYLVTRVGDNLIFVGILGRLLLYLRSLSPSISAITNEPTLSLMLKETSASAIESDECDPQTPLERIISRK